MCINKAFSKTSVVLITHGFWRMTGNNQKAKQDEGGGKERERYLMKINLWMILRTPTRINNSKNNTQVLNRRGNVIKSDWYTFLFQVRWRLIQNLWMMFVSYFFIMVYILQEIFMNIPCIGMIYIFNLLQS